ncbi:MAG: amino acid ABC transporter permease [Thermoflexales bacterium]|nr:amino acid ABC transporter permease [Thermoflexales bacterium]
MEQPSSLPSAASTTPQTQVVDRLAQLPWWLIVIALGGVLLLWQFLTNETYITILSRVVSGIGVTLTVALSGYVIAIVVGLLLGLGRVSSNPVVYNLATLYVQVVRGVPILVLLFYIALVVIPLVLQVFGIRPATFDFTFRAVIALGLAYAGFEAETFRAGIQSISKGQMEAARSLGMSYAQAMRYVILPQAIRRVLPPLGNDFVSMIKDSSLVSVLGVNDITNLARLYAAASFRYAETFNTLAFMYLSLTLLLSLGVRWVEKRLSEGRSG